MRAWFVILAGLALAACGGGSGARREACAAAPVRTGAPPGWTAPAFADSSPGFRVPYAVAGGDAAAAFFFAHPLRAGHPQDPANKVLWVVRAPRDGQPLHITARRAGTTVRLTRPADSGPGEIYPSPSTSRAPAAGGWTSLGGRTARGSTSTWPRPARRR